MSASSKSALTADLEKQKTMAAQQDSEFRSTEAQLRAGPESETHSAARRSRCTSYYTPR